MTCLFVLCVPKSRCHVLFLPRHMFIFSYNFRLSLLGPFPMTHQSLLDEGEHQRSAATTAELQASSVEKKIIESCTAKLKEMAVDSDQVAACTCGTATLPPPPPPGSVVAEKQPQPQLVRSSSKISISYAKLKRNRRKSKSKSRKNLDKKNKQLLAKVEDSNTPPPEQGSWLLRLFESKLFDMSIAISYLFNSKENGVLAYLGNKLFVSVQYGTLFFWFIIYRSSKMCLFFHFLYIVYLTFLESFDKCFFNIKQNNLWTRST